MKSCCCSCCPSCRSQDLTVVQAALPELGAIVRNVNTAGSICVALELPHQHLTVQVPHGNVAIAAAPEADLGVRADGQGISGGGCQLCFDAPGWSCQVKDGQGTGFPFNNYGWTIREQFIATDVVIPVQTVQLGDRSLAAGVADVPHFDPVLAACVQVSGGV